ncbi:toprim domain-containing protein [Achromobacter sp. UMC71]|uniref:toprim domain-containing protein n=1 Tax=Achromobacter sp. UMC71 TaxID=1862320 RepID=UPI0016045848|nr:toprim domain-containing protein [Achromobacter sp. UMC71]MBB1625195.1 toprim domain protein [Achromobacter sp. UMC71]
MKPDILREVLGRLDAFEFKQQGGWLRQGRCPECRKKELYTNAEHPWVLRCGRLNHCGWEGHVKELYSDIFDHWSKRYAEETKTNPNAAADAYLAHARGFDLSRIAGSYTQENYYDRERRIGSATVRFAVGSTYWERLIDEPSRFGKQKARFKPGGTYQGQWWTPPGFDITKAVEIWIVEGIFDAISLWMNGVCAVASLSCSNYPGDALRAIKEARPENLPHLVWAYDGDKAGRSYIRKHAARARADGWQCRAAYIPQNGRVKRDWNDLYLLDQHGQESALQRLSAEGRRLYLYHGSILLAQNATEKAMLMYEHDNSRTEFDFEFGKRLYWFSIDLNAFHKAMDRIAEEAGAADMTQTMLRERALRESGGIRPISNCYPQPLYFQENRITDESWYYFRVEFPHDGPPVKNTFTASQVSTGSEFKKRLLAIAPGAMFSGSSQHLDRMMERRLYNIKRVETVDFIGYSKEHRCYIFGDVAVQEGAIHPVNEEDYFDLGTLAVKSLANSDMNINTNRHDYKPEWFTHLWDAFGARGIVALAYWFASLFAEQIRAEQRSFPFLEVVGEANAGKTTLIEFLWKLFGRDYEGFDPAKATPAARARNFARTSGMPVVLIESDRERIGDDKGSHAKAFDWDELKPMYNGRGIRARGVANGGNDTYEPPFRGAIVISQNAPVNASEAILSRIVHLFFDRAGQSPATFRAAKALSTIPMEDVSWFVLEASKREADITHAIREHTAHHLAALLQRSDIKMTRIAECHAQVMAAVDALRLVVNMSDEQHGATIELLPQLAANRQQVIGTDHPMVQDFWDSYSYLNGDDEQAPALNHSCNDDEIAVNLNHFVEAAATHRQQVPALHELKKVLRTSRLHKFLGVKTVKSRIRQNASQAGSARASTVHCWVFKKGA